MARKTSKKGLHKVGRPRSGPQKSASARGKAPRGGARMQQQTLPFEAKKTETAKALAPRPLPAGDVPVYAQRLLDLTAAHSLATWAAAYLQDEVAGVQARNTFEAKVRDLGAFIGWIAKAHGVAVIEEWMPRDTHRYLKSLERAGKSASTVNRVFASVRRFARWAQEQPGGVFGRHGSPTRGVKELATDEPSCKKLSAQDVHRLLRAADRLVAAEKRKNARPRRNRAILALLLYTGLRVSELTALQTSQWREKHLTNVARKGRGRTKAIYLVKDCLEALSDYEKTERRLDDPAETAEQLFLGPGGAPMVRQTMGALLKAIAYEASKNLKEPIYLHPHRLRHTFGALHRAHSGSDTETAAALGHAGLNHVRRYIRKSDTERQEALEKMFEDR